MGSRVSASQEINRGIELVSSLSKDAITALGKLAGPNSFSSPYVAMGKSGIRHTFTFGVKGLEGTSLASDIVVSSTPIDETKVLSLFIKVYDVGAKHVILGAVPSLTPEAKKLAAGYNVAVVEATEKVNIFSKLAEMLQRVLQE